MKKTIHKYDGKLFQDESLLQDYIVAEIGDMHKFNNGNPENSVEFAERRAEVEEVEVDWKCYGKNADVALNIQPILDEIDIVIHTTLNTKHLNRLIADLQIAVNRIKGKEFYGK